MDFAKKKKKPVEKESKFAALILRLGFVFVVLIGLFFYLFTRNSPGRTNIVIITKNPLLISLDKDQKSATVVVIPESLMLNATYQKGTVLGGSLYKLDTLSDSRGKIIDTTVREFIGIPVDGWVLIDDERQISSSSEFINLLNTEFGLVDAVLPTHKTNLSLFKKPRFINALSSIRPDRINFVDLENSGVVNTITLPDGSVNLEPDMVKLDSYLNQDFNELTILKEGLTIAVLNGSGAPGLATRASRIISNAGGNVIQVSESPLRVVDCVIYTNDNLKDSYTVSRMKSIFNCDISHEVLDESRADLAIVVGDDYNQQVSGISN